MTIHEQPRPVLTRVLCVDDRADNAAVIRMLIDSDPGMTCVGCLESADGLVEDVLGRDPRPDVVILDATMPGRDPLEALGELAARVPATRTLIYSGACDDRVLIGRAMGAGAWGCVDKADAPSSLLRAVREVAAGRTSWAGLDARTQR